MIHGWAKSRAAAATMAVESAATYGQCGLR